MSKGTIVVFLFAFVTSIPHARAQANTEVKKNEVGLVIGATIIPMPDACHWQATASGNPVVGG